VAKAADDGGTDTESDTKFAPVDSRASRGPRHPQAVSIQNHLVPGFGGGGYLCQYVPLIVLKSWGAISYVDTIVCTTRGLHIKHVCNSQHSDVNYLRVLLNIPHEMQEMAAIKSIQVFFISHTAYTQFIVQQVNTMNLLAACQFVSVSLESYQEQFRTMSLCSRFSVKMSRF